MDVLAKLTDGGNRRSRCRRAQVWDHKFGSGKEARGICDRTGDAEGKRCAEISDHAGREPRAFSAAIDTGACGAGGLVRLQGTPFLKDPVRVRGGGLRRGRYLAGGRPPASGEVDYNNGREALAKKSGAAGRKAGELPGPIKRKGEARPPKGGSRQRRQFHKGGDQL